MTYHEVAQFAQTGGLILLAVCFAIAVIYALWPDNKDKFQRAAHAPLESDND